MKSINIAKNVNFSSLKHDVWFVHCNINKSDIYLAESDSAKSPSCWHYNIPTEKGLKMFKQHVKIDLKEIFIP